MRAPFVLLAALLTLPACGATAGDEWIAETPEAARENDIPAVETSVAEVAAEQEEASAESENGLPAPNEDAQPVDRVITLGQTNDSGPAPGEAGGQGNYGAEPSVQINNYYGDSGGYYQPGYVYSPYYYGAPYGRSSYGHSRGGEGGGRRSGGGSMQPGQNWPSVPSYGPAFPYNTAPASPWAPAR